MQLHILPVKYGIYFKIALLTFKCLRGLAPQYSQDVICYNMRKDTMPYDLIIDDDASPLESLSVLILSNLKHCFVCVFFMQTLECADPYN